MQLSASNKIQYWQDSLPHGFHLSHCVFSGKQTEGSFMF